MCSCLEVLTLRIGSPSLPVATECRHLHEFIVIEGHSTWLKKPGTGFCVLNALDQGPRSPFGGRVGSSNLPGDTSRNSRSVRFEATLVDLEIYPATGVRGD